MSVHEKMTAIADAIRGKTGEVDTMTLDEMATAITAISTGGGGNSSGDFSYSNDHMSIQTKVVTIGANTVTLVTNAWDYLAGLIDGDLYTAVLLAEAPTVENQFLARYNDEENTQFIRWRGGAYASAAFSSAYAAKLVEGTQYFLLALTKWA